VRAVVLVGGEGTRLRPLTETIPKPLLPFMNRPFLDHVLDHVADYGVDEVVLSSPYLEDEFRGFLKARREPPAVTWITEERPLGTAGAVAGARDLLEETFLVLNGDVLTDLDLSALLAFHRARGAVATIALARVEDARPFGLVETDRNGRVLAFREKPPVAIPGSINAGTYVLEPEALEAIEPGVPVSIERETYPALIDAGEPVYALVARAYWRDLGTPTAYLEAHLDALGGRLAGRRYPRPLLADGARVNPTAVVGELSVLGPSAAVGPGARVDRSVLHQGATVGERAEVTRSVLGPGSRVGPGADVRDSVLAEDARVPGGARLVGAQVGPGQVAG
jgi:NDP-sugar pyrophosphorylase family protein